MADPRETAARAPRRRAGVAADPTRALHTALWVWPFVGLMQLGVQAIGWGWRAVGTLAAIVGVGGLIGIVRRVGRAAKEVDRG